MIPLRELPLAVAVAVIPVGEATILISESSRKPPTSVATSPKNPPTTGTLVAALYRLLARLPTIVWF